MSPLGLRLWSLSTLTAILLTIFSCSRICEMKSNKAIEDKLDLIYSDSSQGPQTAAAHQQVLFIDHGGGAISHIRRTSFLPNPSVPSFPYRPHYDHHYPNNVFDNNIETQPFANFPEDIPRIDRRSGTTTPSPLELSPQTPPPLPFMAHDLRAQPIPTPIQQPRNHIIPPHLLQQPIPQHISHPIPQHISHPIPQHIAHPIPQPLFHSIPQQPPQHPPPQPIHNPISQPIHFPFPNYPSLHQPMQHQIAQPIPQSDPNPVSAPVRYQDFEPDIDDERFLIHNEIERIPKPSNQIKPSRQEPPPPPPPPPPTPVVHQRPPEQENPFFNFADGPELNFDSPFDPFSQIGPLFQRRRLTSHNNGQQEMNPNSIGYPSYNYYKGAGEENPTTNWPKIFKFTDGRHNLYEFEKQKKQNKIKFNSKESYFDHISRDSFLILHGGTFAQ